MEIGTKFAPSLVLGRPSLHISENDRYLSETKLSALHLNQNNASDKKSHFAEILSEITHPPTLAQIPDWVDKDYSFNPKNPRKPNMRELIEAATSQPIESLYTKSKPEITNETFFAAEILYGVLGTNNDTRDWGAIMSSSDLKTKAREETAKMIMPTIDIETKLDEGQNIIRQSLVIKDKENNILRELNGPQEKIEFALLNFGVRSSDMPSDLMKKISYQHFDKKILDFVTSFLNNMEIPAT